MGFVVIILYFNLFWFKIVWIFVVVLIKIFGDIIYGESFFLVKLDNEVFKFVKNVFNKNVLFKCFMRYFVNIEVMVGNLDFICFNLVIILLIVMFFVFIFFMVFDNCLLICVINEEKFFLYCFNVLVILLLFLVNWFICWVNILILFDVVILKRFFDNFLINGNKVCLECDFNGIFIFGIKVYINCLVELRWFFSLVLMILILIDNWCNVK